MNTPPVYALLDDSEAGAARPTSRLYTGFVRQHRIADPARLEPIWAEVDAELRAGLHAVLLADYAFGAKLVGAGVRDDGAARQGEAGMLRVLMFECMQQLSRDAVGDWLAAAEAAARDGADDGGAAAAGAAIGAAVPGVAGVMAMQPSVDHAEFVQCIGRIHEAIRAGETYQVNYTYRLHGAAYGTPVALYRRLRARQPVAYGALIALPASNHGEAVTHVLSCSPELFLRHQRGMLTARPMKGTASRREPVEVDSESARILSQDDKNRAENLMIVDLLRNDLGRVAQTGTVKVPELFTIEPYSTVFQMTSTVQAELRAETTLPALLRATFPCGSITGAPKHHTMELIGQLESTPRGLYCGAIGWVDAPQEGRSCGDFCLSVAIRTLVLGARRDYDGGDGLRPATLGIGAGIVLDSVADDEYDECRLKGRFVTGLDPGFELFETLLALPGQGLPHRDRHLARLQRSAEALGFAFDPVAARHVLDAAAQDRVRDACGPRRLRLALSHDGGLTLTQAPLQPLAAAHRPVGLIVSPHRLRGPRPLAAHKTSARGHYDEGVHEAERAGAFDSLFFTDDGRLVEGGRSTVCLRLDGRWHTPPLADGALPGVMRGLLIDDPAWHLSCERSLGLEDLHRAEAIVVCNALRGVLPARLLPGAWG